MASSLKKRDVTEDKEPGVKDAGAQANMASNQQENQKEGKQNKGRKGRRQGGDNRGKQGGYNRENQEKKRGYESQQSTRSDISDKPSYLQVNNKYYNVLCTLT